MTADRDRQDFEGFCAEEFHWCGPAFDKDDLGFYISPTVQRSWDAFQAALRIAAERRKQEQPVAIVTEDNLTQHNTMFYEGKAYQWSKTGPRNVITPFKDLPNGTALILRDPEEQQ